MATTWSAGGDGGETTAAGRSFDRPHRTGERCGRHTIVGCRVRPPALRCTGFAAGHLARDFGEVTAEADRRREEAVDWTRHDERRSLSVLLKRALFLEQENRRRNKKSDRTVPAGH